jgi:hypothetical protein
MPMSLFDLAYEVPIIERKVYGGRYTRQSPRARCNGCCIAE